MGVSQLLKELKPCLADCHVERYRGKTVAIDGNAFIFRGAYSCSEQVATGQPSPGAIAYVKKRILMLKHYGVRPWVVLDGRRTPMKEDTNNARREERGKNLRIAMDLKRQAERATHADKEGLLQRAETFFQKAIYVTRQMVTNTLAALRQEGVRCMVAPYEADAQVAFLVKCGLASAVITEDSDILVYMAAVKCTAPVLYKMDGFGECKELAFDAEKISSLPGQIGKFGRGLRAFSGEGGGRMFVQLAALAGCDYVDNVKGLGLLTALPIVSKHRSVSPDRRVSQILMHLRKMKKIVPEGHRERMLRAELSFFWHRVYDPRSETCVHFCSAAPTLVGTAEIPDLPANAEETSFLGEHIDDRLITSIARGDVDPVTLLPVKAETPPPPPTPRRCSTHPSQSRTPQPLSSSTAVAMKSATMPTKLTPRASSGRQDRTTGAGAPPLQHRRRQGSLGGAWAGGHARGGDTTKNTKEGSGGGGGGGLLVDMFERARSRKAEEKENSTSPVSSTPSASNRHLSRDLLQDVSDIVQACRPGETPVRREDRGVGGVGGEEDSGDNSPAAFANPFAKPPDSHPSPAATAAVETPVAVLNPYNFFTPAATSGSADKLSTGSRSNSARRDISSGKSESGIDVWARLGQGLSAAASGGKPAGCRGSVPSAPVVTAKEVAEPVEERGSAEQKNHERDDSVAGERDTRVDSSQAPLSSPSIVATAARPAPVAIDVTISPKATQEREGSRGFGAPKVAPPDASTDNKRPLTATAYAHHTANGEGARDRGGKKSKLGTGGRGGTGRSSASGTKKGTATLLSFFNRAPAPSGSRVVGERC